MKKKIFIKLTGLNSHQVKKYSLSARSGLLKDSKKFAFIISRNLPGLMSNSKKILMKTLKVLKKLMKKKLIEFPYLTLMYWTKVQEEIPLIGHILVLIIIKQEKNLPPAPGLTRNLQY